MKDPISVWIAAGGALVATIIAAVTAAWLAPLFQHGIWKKQKLREVRLDIARQFQAVTDEMAALWMEETDPNLYNKTIMQMNSLLNCARVLFTRPETLQRRSVRRLRRISTVPSRFLPFMPLLETPGMTAASLPYASTAAVCLRPYTGGSTIPFPNSPNDTCSRCHDGAIHSLAVRPERLPVPPDWVLRLRVGSAAT